MDIGITEENKYSVSKNPTTVKVSKNSIYIFTTINAEYY
jgi:hypothetical protein